jgi:hypothetical protein
MANLIALPDELLLNITCSLDRHDLYYLVRSHPRFRAVVREALVEKATVSPVNILKLVDHLHQYSSIAPKLAHLRLGTLPIQNLQKMKVASDHYQDKFTDEAISSCSEIVRRGYPGADMDAWLKVLREENDFFAIGIALLIAQITNMTSLTVETDTLIKMPMMRALFVSSRAVQTGELAATSWVREVRALIYTRLKTLTIYGKPGYRGVGIMELMPFVHLQELQVPYSWFGAAHLSDLRLPNSLQVLKITSAPIITCGLHLLEILKKLKAVPNLQSVELLFEHNVWAFAWSVYVIDTQHVAYAYDEQLDMEMRNELPFVYNFKFGSVRLGYTQSGPQKYHDGDLAAAIKYLTDTHSGLGSRNHFIRYLIGDAN